MRTYLNWLGTALVGVSAKDGKLLWKYTKTHNTTANVPTPLVKGDLLFMWSDAGVVTCANVATGEVYWRERVPGNYFGSPVWVDRRLFCVSTAGEIVALEASDKFNVLHRYALNELCHSTPAVALGRLFVRTEKHLWSIGGQKEPAR